MSSHVYLIKNGDLYNIGWTNNLDKTILKLKPGNLIVSIQTNDPIKDYKSIVSIYSNDRLPASDYYRLTKSQAQKCKEQLEGISDGNYYQPFFTGIRLIFVFAFAWFFISFIIINFGLEPLFSRFS